MILKNLKLILIATFVFGVGYVTQVSANCDCFLGTKDFYYEDRAGNCIKQTCGPCALNQEVYESICLGIEFGLQVSDLTDLTHMDLVNGSYVSTVVASSNCSNTSHIDVQTELTSE